MIWLFLKLESKSWQLDLNYSFCRLCWSFKLKDNQHLAKPLDEMERFVHYWRRQTRLTYIVPLVASEKVTPVERVEPKEPIVIAEIKARDMKIRRTTSVIVVAHQCIVHWFIAQGSQVHIQNFLEISDTYTPTWVNSDYGRLA